MDKVLGKLNMPTPKSEIKYRVGTIYDKINGKATVLSYVDARYVQDTLDNLVGTENWENRFYEAKGALFCEITINLGSVKISKSDCGTESDIAPAKGEASDAFKRAAVMFGIGRDLYSAETHFADLKKKGSKWVLPRDWKPENKPTKRSGGMSQVAAELDEKYDGSEGVDLEKEMTTEDVADNLGGEVIGDDVEPKIKNIINFGTKYKGKDWSEADDGYVNWCSGKDGKGGSVVDWQKQQGLEEWERRNSKKEDNPIPE